MSSIPPMSSTIPLQSCSYLSCMNSTSLGFVHFVISHEWIYTHIFQDLLVEEKLISNRVCCTWYPWYPCLFTWFHTCMLIKFGIWNGRTIKIILSKSYDHNPMDRLVVMLDKLHMYVSLHIYILIAVSVRLYCFWCVRKNTIELLEMAQGPFY